MAQTLSAPSTVPPGSTVVFQDGSTGTVAADGTLSVPNGNVSALLNAGWEYASTDAGSVSNVVSTADSKGVSSGTRASVASSAGVSNSINTSTADSKGESAGVRASIAMSEAIS